VETGQNLGGILFFAGGQQRPIIPLQPPQVRFDTAVVLMFAFVRAHASLG
jgi:hypothetical protein